MRRVVLLIIVGGIAVTAGCKQEDSKMAKGTFADDLAFLKEHTEVVVLSDSTGNSQVAVVPDMQGRAMTSTAGGPDGLSFGWINRELVASGKFVEHIVISRLDGFRRPQ